MDDTQNSTPSVEEVLQSTPTPDEIEQQFKANVSLQQAGQVLGFLVQQVQNILLTLTARNPRLSLAIVSELKLVYEKILIDSLVKVEPKEQEAANVNQ